VSEYFRDDWPKLEIELRNKIKQVVPCDVHLANPLHPLKIDMVDAICTSLCLEVVSPDVPSYAKALENVVSLLKPGGMLVLIGVFDNAMYTVGHKVFNHLVMEK
jgi:SAM-dependent methyltransferase